MYPPKEGTEPEASTVQYVDGNKKNYYSFISGTLLSSLVQEADEILSNVDSKQISLKTNSSNNDETENSNQTNLMTKVLDKVLCEKGDSLEAYNKCAQLRNNDFEKKVAWNACTSESVLNKRIQTKAECVWNTYHDASSSKTASSKSKQSKSPRNKKKLKEKKKKDNFKKSSDMYEAAKHWGNRGDDSNMEKFLTEIKGLFAHSQISCKRWRYQMAGTALTRPMSACEVNK